MTKKRDSWASRATFIFAAIGSAVGLGNAWRFPGLAAMHGGGTFLLVYILAMFILGWPLLMMEISIGRKMQHGAPGAFRGLNKKAEFVGWAAVANAFVIVTYYAVVLAWILVMIVKSFKLGGLTSEEAGGIFFGEALQYQPISSGAGAFDIPGGLFVALIIAWIAIYLCIRKGAHSAGKVVPFTVIIPVVLLIVLAINGMVKDFGNASGAGLKQFFIPDFSKLGNSGLWIDAFGQVFYSLSIMMAIMIAYGSFVNKKSDIVKDTLIIAISDMAISVLAGIVLFTTLSGTGMLESYLANPSGGIGTAFVVYPQAMVMLSSNAAFNSFIAFLFYMTLLTLAIDSAFSIVEGVATSISDKFKLDPRKTRLTTCLCAALVSVLYITKGGLEWLDIVDKWANSFSLILVGIIECIVVGWFFKTSKVRDELNRTATTIKIKSGYDWIIKIVAPLLLGGLFIWNLIDTIKSYGGEGGGYGGYPIWAQVIAGWLVFIAVFVIGIVLQLVTNHSKKFAMLEKDYKAWDDMHDEEIEELVNEGVEESEAEAIVLNSAVEEAPSGENAVVVEETSNDTDAQ
ncbi:MAG: sodium-dependent transporter [Christensenellales bacterium]